METTACAYKLLESIKYLFDVKYSLQLHAQDNPLTNYIFDDYYEDRVCDGNNIKALSD